MGQISAIVNSKIARGEALRARLYIPEVFCIEQRGTINARRLAQWAPAMAVPGRPRRLMLLIAEIKEIVPARFGFKAVIKHVPDQAFLIDRQLYGRMARRFENELDWWGSAENLHMVKIATFGVSAAGVPLIAELSLMPVTRHRLPAEGSFELQLVEILARAGRSFIKGLRYNLPSGQSLACAMLTDVAESPIPLFIATEITQKNHAVAASHNVETADLSAAWVWRNSHEAMPPLPKQKRLSAAA